jgi:hypothetical protein
MIALSLVVAALALSAPQDGQQIRQDTLRSPGGGEPRLRIRQPQEPLSEPRLSPKTFGDNRVRYEYDWITWGLARLGNSEQFDLRFRVYSQERKADGDTAIAVTRMMLRLWELNQSRLRLDHPRAYHASLVNVFLSWGGQPGGEQAFATAIEGDRQVRLNTIYLYDLASFTDPLERAREVAHEYGHATLPAVGGYREPEEWANGFLGEKLYLMWLRDLLKAGDLEPDDAMGASVEQIERYLAAEVTPLVSVAAGRRPTQALLSDRSKQGMDNYIGLNLYMASILPERVFARSLVLIGSQRAEDYPEGLMLAMEEPDEVPLRIPEALRGKQIWVPVGKRQVSGARVVRQESGWAQIEAPSGADVVLR